MRECSNICSNESCVPRQAHYSRITEIWTVWVLSVTVSKIIPIAHLRCTSKEKISSVCTNYSALPLFNDWTHIKDANNYIWMHTVSSSESNRKWFNSGEDLHDANYSLDSLISVENVKCKYCSKINSTLHFQIGTENEETQRTIIPMLDFKLRFFTQILNKTKMLPWWQTLWVSILITNGMWKY